jgi:isopenicillin N synthase-like dioxygenase
VQHNQIRCGEHTDYGALTLLFQDSTGGLEVKSKTGEWIPAVHFPNTILINVGDVMEMWTNGLLKSTLHRVINPNDGSQHRSRYSAVFFCQPDLNSEIKCLEAFVSTEKPAGYPKKLFKEHLFGKYSATYSAKFE